MAELPKGVRLASGYFVQKGGVVTGRLHKVGGVSRDRIGDFEFKDAFHLDLHLSYFTTSSWNYNICMI